MTFEQLQLSEPILKALRSEGYEKPTPIQEKSIPEILRKNDILGCAQTGTGKTAAFAIPLLQLISGELTRDSSRRTIKALVLTPTRELALQISESFTAYGRYLPIKSQVIFGGVSQVPQVQALRQGTDILVATPGRLIDLLNQQIISLRDIKYLVLDEADRMLDMGFVHDVKRIIAKIPVQRQTLFFSATMPSEIKELANSILRNPVHVEVTPVSSTVEKISQRVFFVSKGDKINLLIHLLESHSINSTLVFARTKHGADKIAKVLVKSGISAEAIHGNKSQNARQNALQKFKARQCKVLVATDIAARGIDIDELSFVINFDLPNVPETYVHRIGRTGRAGADGKAFSFCDAEERAYLKDIQKLTRKTIDVEAGHPFENGGKPVSGSNITQRVSLAVIKAPASHRPAGRKRFHPNRKTLSNQV